MEQPPKSVFEDRANHHLVVALADVALVVEALVLRVVDSLQLLVYSLH